MDLSAYTGTKKIVGRERRISVTGWGVKISPQGGGPFEEQGGGREVEFKKKSRKQCLYEKSQNFFASQEIFFLEIV